MAPYFTLNFPYSLQVDATIQLDTVTKLGSAGVIFNYIDSFNYYALEVYTSGNYSIVEKTNNSDSVLVTQTLSNAINTGSGVKNTIKIKQNTTSLQLFINNISVATFAIPLAKTYSQVGLFTETRVPTESYSPTNGLFNNFALTRL